MVAGDLRYVPENPVEMTSFSHRQLFGKGASQ